MYKLLRVRVCEKKMLYLSNINVLKIKSKNKIQTGMHQPIGLMAILMHHFCFNYTCNSVL